MNRPTFKDVPARVDVNEMEKGVLEFWERDKTFEKSLDRRKDKPLFTFYDGPPYATGKPHYGHVLQSSIKDAVLRYKTMRGYYVPRRVGWDTHGLPVEVFVEKELGLKTKKDVLAYGIENFNKKCREIVFRYIDLWVDTLKRLGRWADYENGYATLDLDYMESEWGVFQHLWDKGLIYKDFRSTPYCVRCGTPLSNYEAGEGYKDKTDVAVYVKLRITTPFLPLSAGVLPLSSPYEGEGGRAKRDRGVYLLVWTTTPWTLPANVAVAVNKDLQYVSVEFEGEEYVVAERRVEAIFGKAVRIVKKWSLDDLMDLKYEALYEIPSSSPLSREERERIYRVVLGDHVTAEEGTGLVHMAPAFGAEDQLVGKQNNLPVLRTVDVSGNYNMEPWTGKSLWEVNKLVAKDLQERGLLFKEEQYTHSYPHCWRCDEPLIYYALDTWFVKVTDLKERMLEANEQINWIPEHIKHGRFAKGIEMAPDWAVSRNRFWSVPMPIWECGECGERTCVGSIKELKKLSGASTVEDLHRPYVDELTWECQKCSGTMRRVEEVLDVWFDSGSMPYIQPGFPADFIAESIEMTRAWFYFMHVLATAIRNQPAYKNVIGSGIIFGDDGNKLSKKLKNYPEIDPTVEKYGADTVRMFFLSSTFGEPYVFAVKELQELFRNFTMRLWNVYSFYVRYANVAKVKTPAKNLKLLDRWILARLKQLEFEVISASDAYRMDNAARAFVPFVDDLSNWYVRRSRDRFQPSTSSGQDQAAFETLHDVLVRLVKLLAPFMPFMTEEIYRNLTGDESVHLQDIADSDEILTEEKSLLTDMALAREIVSSGLALRAKAGIKVRQPLAEVVVAGGSFSEEITRIVQDELNVKVVKFGDNLPEESEFYMITGKDEKVLVALNTEITVELKREGIARDIIRHGQVLRRKAGYELDDKVCLGYETESALLNKVLEEHKGMITTYLQVDDVSHVLADADATVELSLEGERIRLGVKKN